MTPGPILVRVNESVVISELSAQVADALEATGRSTHELARMLGINQSTVSRLMRRQSASNPAMLERVLNLLGYDVHVTVTESETPHNASLHR